MEACNETKRWNNRVQKLWFCFNEFWHTTNIDIPVLKSEAYGHKSYNLPIPFGTPASIYSEKTTSCQGSCNGFIMEINSPFCL